MTGMSDHAQRCATLIGRNEDAVAANERRIRMSLVPHPLLALRLILRNQALIAANQVALAGLLATREPAREPSPS